MPASEKRVPVLIASWLDAGHAARIAAAEPKRIELLYEPDLLPTTRYESGPPWAAAATHREAAPTGRGAFGPRGGLL
jgi:hypothetical protein